MGDAAVGHGVDFGVRHGRAIRAAVGAGAALVALAALATAVPALASPLRAGAGFRDCRAGCPEMVPIPAGSFRMGADAGEDGRPEGAPHTVTIARPFALAAREVSNAEYARFLTETGRQPSPGCRSYDPKTGKVDPDPASNSRHPGPGAGDGKPDMPAVCVSWLDARAYVAWLSRKTGKPYRLPSEAEWEYGARAGTTGDFYWGTSIDAGCAFANTLDVDGMKAGTFAVFSAGSGPVPSTKCSDGHAGTAPVGSFKPNAFGLYDMIGNVWEWVEDCYAAPYPANAPTDGSAYEVSGPCPRRAVRSGSWMSVPFRNRASWRGRDPEDLVSWIFGFRVARDLSARGR